MWRIIFWTILMLSVLGVARSAAQNATTDGLPSYGAARMPESPQAGGPSAPPMVLDVPSLPNRPIRETHEVSQRGPVRLAQNNSATNPASPSTVSAGREERLPLKASTRDMQGRVEGGAKSSGLQSPLMVFGSLAVVLGAFFLFAWVLRRTARPGATLLPREVFEVLGRAPLTGRQQVQLVRCGAKLLLVSTTMSGAETLTEVTDPAEVERMVATCRAGQSTSAAKSFRRVLEQVGGNQAAKIEDAAPGEQGYDIAPSNQREHGHG